MMRAVAACLCETFDVGSVEELGHGPLPRLLAAAMEGVTAPSRSVWAAAALAAGCQASSSNAAAPGAAAVEAPGLTASGGDPARGHASREAALAVLQAAPDLSDLQLWSQWQQVSACAGCKCLGGKGGGGAAGRTVLHIASGNSIPTLCSSSDPHRSFGVSQNSHEHAPQVFAPTLGPLPAFLRREGTASGLLALELAVHQERRLPCLQLPTGRLIKLRPAAELSDFVDCCARVGGLAMGNVCE